MPAAGVQISHWSAGGVVAEKAGVPDAGFRATETAEGMAAPSEYVNDTVAGVAVWPKQAPTRANTAMVSCESRLTGILSAGPEKV